MVNGPDTSPDGRPTAESGAGEAATPQEGYYFDVERSPEAMRRLALLWGPPEPSARGRKPRFTLPQVVDAGLRVVAGGDLTALTMRAVAQELGVGTMSLYTYVPGRAELIDLMIDRVYAELDLPTGGMPWRAALAQYAREHYGLYLRHPWVLQTNLWRAPLAPHVLDAQECGLRILVEAGLPEPAAVQTVGLIGAVVQGVARHAVAERMEQEATGQGVGEYWDSLSSFWVDYFDAERYPTMLRVFLAGGFGDVVDPFEAPLEQLLHGVELAIDQAAAGGGEDT